MKDDPSAVHETVAEHRAFFDSWLALQAVLSYPILLFTALLNIEGADRCRLLCGCCLFAIRQGMRLVGKVLIPRCAAQHEGEAQHVVGRLTEIHRCAFLPPHSPLSPFLPA